MFSLSADIQASNLLSFTQGSSCELRGGLEQSGHLLAHNWQPWHLLQRADENDRHFLGSDSARNNDDEEPFGFRYYILEPDLWKYAVRRITPACSSTGLSDGLPSLVVSFAELGLDFLGLGE